MKILEAQHITKRFPGIVALNDVDVSFELGKIHCIIGENGAGKSTLIKALTGVYTPEEGVILIDGKDALVDNKLFGRVAYVPQELDLFKSMTVADNLFMPFKKSGFKNMIISNKELYQKAIPYLEKFQITAQPDDLVGDISVSEQQLLQIARATVDQYAEIIMLDEPTTSLTLKDTERLFEVIGQLKNENKAIVFISHKLEEIFSIGDEITVLRNGEKVAAADIKDVDIPWVVSQMTGQELDASMTFHPSKVTDRVIMKVENLTGEKFTNVSFDLKAGEILGFSGLVGSGRTEIMQTIFGFLPAWKGKMEIEGKKWKFNNTNYSVNNGLIYIPEERKNQGILPVMSVKDNITMPLMKEVKGVVGISASKEKKISKDVVDSYQVKTTSLAQEIRFLSGGNQQKIIIGRSMYCKPKVLIFDEPTKGIDVGTKAEIYKLMKSLAEDDGIGIILISSELEEVLKCSNRVITVYNGRKVGEFETEKADKTTIINSILGIGSN